MPNASFTMRLGVRVERYTLSFVFSTYLTAENTYSKGIKSRLYGGRNTNRAPTSFQGDEYLHCPSQLYRSGVVPVKWKY